MAHILIVITYIGDYRRLWPDDAGIFVSRRLRECAGHHRKADYGMGRSIAEAVLRAALNLQ